MISFILNDSLVESHEPEGTVLLDIIRYQQQLPGTKIGCREGDCGACTVLVGELKNAEVEYRSMTSCLLALANVQGKHIVTVEGLNMKELSPVQKAVVDESGTQCGFCAGWSWLALLQLGRCGFSPGQDRCQKRLFRA